MTAPSGLRRMAMSPVEKLGRASSAPMLVRLVAALAGFGAAAFAAAPELLLDRPAGFAFLAGTGALLVGLLPRTRWVGTFLLLVVIEWLISTLAFGVAPDLVRVGGLAAFLYLCHAAAAFAAVLPYDCMVPIEVFGRWAMRVGTVLVVGIGVGVGGFALVGLLTAVPTVIGAIIGSVVAAGLVGLLAWHLHRRLS